MPVCKIVLNQESLEKMKLMILFHYFIILSSRDSEDHKKAVFFICIVVSDWIRRKNPVGVSS